MLITFDSFAYNEKVEGEWQMMTLTAIITGASSGIGKAIAEKFAKENMNVVLAARNEDKLEKIAQTMNEVGSGKVLAIPTDVSKQEDVVHLYNKTIEAFGAVDIYINNAGAMLSAAVTDGELEEWETMIDVNIKGALYGLHQVIPGMIERKTGHIINIASVSGHEVTKKSTVYSATKFAVRAISMGLEKELAHTGVRITNVSPGMVDTSLASRANMTRKPLDAADIADAIYEATQKPSHVNVNEITIRPV